MRQIFRNVLVAVGVAAGVPVQAGPILSKGGNVPAFEFPAIPGVPRAPSLPNFDWKPPELHGTGGNPGVTKPLVPPTAGGTADRKAAKPENRADILNELFQRLSSSTDSAESGTIAVSIEHVWLESGSDTADLLMVRTVTAIGKGDSDLAAKLLDRIVGIDPTWAEAWNKRATLRFLSGDDRGAMDDISHVLTLEPRHFGALSGMGFILQRNGMKKQALAMIRKAAEIYPHNAELEKVLSNLTLDVEGRDI